MPSSRGRAPHRILGACAALVLCVGCGTSGGPGGPPTRAPAATARPWTAAQADQRLSARIQGFSADLDDFYRQRSERHPVATYAVQCGVLQPELARFTRFLKQGRWPAAAAPLAEQLIDAQTTYDAGLRACRAALTERELLASFRTLDAAPIQQRLTRLRTALTAGAP